MILVSHVILQDHVIKKPYDVVGEEPVQVNDHLVKFGGHRHCGSEDIKILVSHVIL